jgi:cytidine deaminase
MTSDLSPTLLELHGVAQKARDQAYAPYSGFAVGAALLSSDGSQFVGVNVENVSYSVTMCAERVALGAAVAAGCRHFDAVAIAAAGPAASPCGACRQALAEFSPDLQVVFPLDGSLEVMSIAELLPASFRAEALAQPALIAVS